LPRYGVYAVEQRDYHPGIGIAARIAADHISDLLVAKQLASLLYARTTVIESNPISVHQLAWCCAVLADADLLGHFRHGWETAAATIGRLCTRPRAAASSGSIPRRRFQKSLA
jgi:hypothetical protein